MQIGEPVQAPAPESEDDDDPPKLRSVIVRLIDNDGKVMAGAPYELQVGDRFQKGKTGKDGIVREKKLLVPGRCLLKYGYPPRPGELPDNPPVLPFEVVMFLNYDEVDGEDPDEGARRRLHNLGYAGDFADDVAAFQKDFDLEEAEWFDQATWDKLRGLHDHV